ncbi:hypothetical protein Tco_0699112 [Tanacetum coccineum]
MVQDTPVEEATFMAIEESDESDSEQEKDDQFSHHAFMFHPGPLTKIADMLLSCPKCQLTTCSLCARNYLGKTVNVKGKQPHKPEEEKDFSSNEVRLLKELLKKKTEQVQQMIRDQAKEYYETRLCIETEVHYSGNATASPKVRKITNQLYNVKVEFDIPNCPTFGTTAIIDTGASACCINKKVIPEEALKPLTQIVFFNGLNLRQQATHRLKQGSNFLRSMKGGIRIEGDEITIYKKVTRIMTSNQTKVVKIAELKVSEEEFLEINESIYFNQEGSKAFLEQFKPVIDRLKHQGYIGEEPLKHWKKNGELCKLDIINPDITIEDRPLKHVTPKMEDSFKKHVDGHLKIGAIRPSKSRHRTMAMIVNSGTTINHATGREIKGK